MYLTKTRTGRKLFSVVAIAVFSFAFTPIGVRTAAAAPAEQVIFSGEGVTNDGAHRVGYWIWCMPEGNSPIYTGACRGSVLLRGEGPAVGVAGFIGTPGWDLCGARLFDQSEQSFSGGGVSQC